MAKKPKVQENYKTPNEKYNAEFAVENDGATQQGTLSKAGQKVQENYKTPNEKYNAEFAVENDGTTK
ncbi:hypothetical protein [Paenibacillus ihuae]|uniref:hypothetical protein n=1 Tax=Paenibacillus ihuae TaxID=1232431 RepID=UPI0006D53E64|nr:hypothetical protein [Paenibacillus ihuae]